MLPRLLSRVALALLLVASAAADQDDLDAVLRPDPSSPRLAQVEAMAAKIMEGRTQNVPELAGADVFPSTALWVDRMLSHPVDLVENRWLSDTVYALAHQWGRIQLLLDMLDSYERIVAIRGFSREPQSPAYRMLRRLRSASYGIDDDVPDKYTRLARTVRIARKVWSEQVPQIAPVLDGIYLARDAQENAAAVARARQELLARAAAIDGLRRQLLARVRPKMLRISAEGVRILEWIAVPVPEDAVRIARQKVPLSPSTFPQPAPVAPPAQLPSPPAGIFLVSGRARTAEDVELPSEQRLRLAEIPAEQGGLVSQVFCAIRAAPIFEEGGRLSVQVSVETPEGEATTLCSVALRGPSMSNWVLGRNAISVQAGDVITLSCRSFTSVSQRVQGRGCSVDVDVWVKPKTAPGPTSRRSPVGPQYRSAAKLLSFLLPDSAHPAAASTSDSDRRQIRADPRHRAQFRAPSRLCSASRRYCLAVFWLSSEVAGSKRSSSLPFASSSLPTANCDSAESSHSLTAPSG